jgi:hypothetical protein
MRTDSMLTRGGHAGPAMPLPPPRVRRVLVEVLGKSCRRVEVGTGRSLRVSLGQRETEPQHGRLLAHGQWELRTWDADWRILAAGDVLFGSGDAGGDAAAANKLLKRLQPGVATGWRLRSRATVGLAFDSGLEIEILRVCRGPGEWFHLFGPAQRYLELAGAGRWTMGFSDQPWPAARPD